MSVIDDMMDSDGDAQLRPLEHVDGDASDSARPPTDGQINI